LPLPLYACRLSRRFSPAHYLSLFFLAIIRYFTFIDLLIFISFHDLPSAVIIAAYFRLASHYCADASATPHAIDIDIDLHADSLVTPLATPLRRFAISPPASLIAGFATP